MTIDSLTPSSMKTGDEVQMKATGNLDQAVRGDFTFDIQMAGQFVNCPASGSVGSRCGFPLNLGYIEIKPLAQPVKAGSLPIAIDVEIPKLLPTALLETTNKITGVGKTSGNKIFCMNVFTALSPLSNFSHGILDVTWADCGDADSKAAINDLSPKTLEKNIVGNFIADAVLSEDLDEDIHIEAAMNVKFLHFTGSADQTVRKNFPLNLGHLEWEAMPSPLEVGPQELNVNLKLANLFPDGTISTSTVQGKAVDGTSLFCMNIHTKRLVSSSVLV